VGLRFVPPLNFAENNCGPAEQLALSTKKKNHHFEQLIGKTVGKMNCTG
jgi:hypothetical protein